MFLGINHTSYSETLSNGTIYNNNITVQNITLFNHGVATGTNQASMDFTTSSLVNSTFNVSGRATTEAENENICENWKEAQHALFQLANLCFAISFLTPSGFKYHCLFLRSLLLVGFSMFIFWSGLVVCMLDVLGWNVAFFIINICHIIYLGYSTYPVKFHSELEELYIKIFKPLKMTRFEFKLLTKLGKRCNLLKGSMYASEGVTCCGEKFSILLKGRLKVMVNRVFLHHIDPNEFVDSPEYESATNENLSDEKYQVTISAVEDSCVLVWPVETLDQFLQSNEYFSMILTTLIGKDITHKMYQIQEMLLNRSRDGAVHDAVLSRCPSSIINMRSNIVRSSSEHSLQHLSTPDEEFKGIQFSASAFTNSHQSSTKTLPSSNTYETSV